MRTFLLALLVADVADASAAWTAGELQNLVARTAQPEGVSQAGTFFMHGSRMAAVPYFQRANPGRRTRGAANFPP